jgi:hypothetical protein
VAMTPDFASTGKARYPLRGIVEQLPHYSGPAITPEKSVDCLKVNIEASGRYVWPDLFVETSGDTPARPVINSPIVLISAPGAMGKSVAAAAVAAEINAPLIDLSSLSVGSDTLTGLLASVLGWVQAPRLISDLRSGKAAIVLDGLDEAQLRAGRDHTIAFLNNIVELVRDATVACGQIIIFGRREAAETSFLVFDDNNVNAIMTAIAPLTHEQSNELIDLELSGKTIGSRPYDVHKTHPVPFGELRDSLFREIAVALGAADSDGDEYWNEVGDFLGYPPVLLVFAERLAVDNPSAELAQTRVVSGEPPRHVNYGDLLKKIVEGILDREKQKVRNQLSQALSFTASDPRSQVCTRERSRLSAYSSTLLAA